jgi:hypothetical protein
VEELEHEAEVTGAKMRQLELGEIVEPLAGDLDHAGVGAVAQV